MLDRPEDEAEQDAAAAEATDKRKRELLARSRHDQMLLATYTPEQQIETAKQRRLQTPQLSSELNMKKTPYNAPG